MANDWLKVSEDLQRKEARIEALEEALNDLLVVEEIMVRANDCPVCYGVVTSPTRWGHRDDCPFRRARTLLSTTKEEGHEGT